MDNISIGFLLDLIFENNKEVSQAEEPVEATPEIINSFFR